MKLKLLALMISTALCIGSAVSSVKAQDGFTFKKPLIPVTRDFKLSNGLRVLFAEDHSVPAVAVAIVYDVGARDERKTRSGFAHLFEHMMFQGSDNVAKTEHFKYVQAVGGAVNASTHSDFTNYYDKVPSNDLELVLWLESDRMRSLKVTPENFENQLQTVKEEKRLSIDNQPYLPAAVKMEELVYDNWANAHPTIGDFEDLEASSINDVRQFFGRYYVPNNAVMAIVGDIDCDQARKMVEKYFGTIAGRPLPVRPSLTEPCQVKAKYARIDDPLAQMPAFWVTWKAPVRREPDYYALGLIEKILSAGDSSRLYQRLVKTDKVALRADASYEERRGPSLFETFVVYKPSFTAGEARAILLNELDKLKATPVSREELDKAKNQILRDLFSSGCYSSLQRSVGRAEMLAEYASFFGDPGLIDKDIECYMKVTPDDIQRVARKVFSKEGSTVVDVHPTAQDKASAPHPVSAPPS